MSFDLIECFVELANAGSLSKASVSLNLTQSAVSKRLQQLEDELGVQLLLRGPGVRGTVLTSAGIRFLSIAQDMMHLYHEALRIKDTVSVHQIQLGATDMLNNYLLSPFFEKCMDNTPNISLKLMTANPTILFESLLNHTSDIVLCFQPPSSPNFIVHSLFNEGFCIVRNDGTNTKGEPLRTSECIPNQEVFVSWSPEFEEWHGMISGHCRNFIDLSSTTTALIHLRKPGRWAYMPYSFVEIATKINPSLSYYSIDDDFIPPSRTCLQIERVHQQVKLGSEFDEFKLNLYHYLSSLQGITLSEYVIKFLSEKGNMFPTITPPRRKSIN